MSKYTRYAIGLLGLYILGTLPAKFTNLHQIFDIQKYSDMATIFWILLIIVIIRFTPRIHMPGRVRYFEVFVGFALSGAIIFIAIRFGAGFLLKSVAASPYNLEPMGIFVNLFEILPALIARELVRAYALGAIYRNSKKPIWWTVLLTIFFALLEINYNKIVLLSGMESTIIYICRDVLPIFSSNALLSMLVLYGGAKAGILFSGIQTVFYRVFPFIPSLPWIGESALGLTFPALFALFVRDQMQTLNRERAIEYQNNITGFAASLVIIVSFAWFVVGVFPIYPLVVLTGSMEPLVYPGDVVLVERISKESEVKKLAVGDIINFDREDINITHRIIRIENDDAGNISFETRGDNNDSADTELVKPNDVNGTIIEVVPKVGLPVLLMNFKNPIPEGVVDDNF